MRKTSVGSTYYDFNYLPLVRAFFAVWQDRDYDEWLDWTLNRERCFLELREQ